MAKKTYFNIPEGAVPDLPDGYVWTEYIESDGSQYIDTGVMVTKDNVQDLKVVADVSILQLTDWTLCGANGPYFYFGVVQGGKIGYGTGSSWGTSGVTADTDRHTWIIDAPNGVFSVPDKCIKITGISFSTTLTASNEFIIGGCSDGSDMVLNPERIYSFKIYNGGVLVRDFVPCINADGIVGLYDFVDGEFYANSGTGGFVAGGTRQANLPNGYTQMKYIESGGDQYIDTGIIPDQDTRVVLSAKITYDPTGHQALFGSRKGTTKDQFWCYWQNDSQKFAFRYGGGTTNNMVAAESTARGIFDANKRVFSVNGNSVTAASATFETGTTAYLFALNNAGAMQYPASARVYWCEIYSNDVLVRDYVACMNPRGELGLYDLVEGVFYGNSGVGRFVSGDGMYPALPSGYERLEYVESTGKQCIKTGFKPNQDTRVVMDIQMTSAGSSQFCFGTRTTSSTQNYSFMVNTGGVFRSDYNASQLSMNLNTFSRKIIDKDKNKCMVDGVAVTNTAGTFTSSFELYLLAVNQGGSAKYFASAKLYSCRVYDNGKLVRNFVPCRNPNGVIGMYDLANKKFYAGAGSAVLENGPTVTASNIVRVDGMYVGVDDALPVGYAMLEYIESDGNQYVNTGVLPSEKTAVKLDAKANEYDVSLEPAFFGVDDGRLYCVLDPSGVKNYWAYYMPGANNGSTGWTTDLYTRGIIEMSAESVSYHGGSVTPAASVFSYSIPLFLFAANQNGTMSRGIPMRLYRAQIYDNGEMVRDYIPCRNADGEAGLYDLVGEEFYHNEGAGAFSGGGEIYGVAMKVLKGYVSDYGVGRQFFAAGRRIDSYRVGDIAQIAVNGVPTEFVVVHKGNPDASIYDVSCDGVWLLAADKYTERYYNRNTSRGNVYAESHVRDYLEETFYGLIDQDVREVIKTVKIPHLGGNNNYSNTLYTGAEGLEARVFLLSTEEIGSVISSNVLRGDGSCLRWFADNSQEVTFRLPGDPDNGAWWTRTGHYYTHAPGNTTACQVGAFDGEVIAGHSAVDSSSGIRPAFVLPYDAVIPEVW